MAGVNKVILVGNVGKDPEVRYLENNVCVANFSLATSESFKGKDGNKVEQTEWHKITLWRGLAEVAEKYVRKGSQVYIEGKIKTRSYDDKDGVKKYITEIVGDNMTLLGKRGSDDGASSGYSAPASEPAKASEPAAASTSSAPTDDLPF